MGLWDEVVLAPASGYLFVVVCVVRRYFAGLGGRVSVVVQAS